MVLLQKPAASMAWQLSCDAFTDWETSQNFKCWTSLVKLLSGSVLVSSWFLCVAFYRQLQQQQAELEVHQRDSLTAYDLSQVRLLVCTDVL